MKRPITYHHIALDAPTYVRDNETLERRHFISGGSMIGRILFATPEPTVKVIGTNCVIRHCYFEGGHVGIEFADVN